MLRTLHLFTLLISAYCLLAQSTQSASSPVYETVVAESATFTFFYTGPSEISVDENCVGILNWGHPNTPTVEYEGPGELVSFDILSISGGYGIDDVVPVGTDVFIAYLAEDDMGNSAEFTFTIRFIDSTPPVIDLGTTPPAIVVFCLTEVPGAEDVAVTDNCDESGSSVTITISGTPTFEICEGGEYVRTITATDISGNSSTMEQEVIVLPDSEPPIITKYPKDHESPCGLVSFQYPKWIIDEVTVMLAFDQGCGDVNYFYEGPELSEIVDSCGPIVGTFVAEDICGNRTTAEATFTIVDTKSPDIIKSASNLIVDCDIQEAQDEIQDWLDNHGGAVVEDDCTDVSWTYTPETINYTDACNNPLKINFIATDKCGNRTISSAFLEIRDTTPPIIIEEAGVVLMECSGAEITEDFQDFLVAGSGIEVIDYCSPLYAMSYKYIFRGDSLSREEIVDSFMVNNQASVCEDILIDTITYSQVVASISYEVLIVDGCGNGVRSDTIHYLVRDTTPPVIEKRARDTTFYCDQMSSTIDSFSAWYNRGAGAEVDDYCSDVLIESSPSYDSLMRRLNARHNVCGESIPLYFKYSDNCGNFIEDTIAAIFTILDTIPPEIITPPTDTIVNCSPELDTVLYQWIQSYASANVEDACTHTEWLYYGYVDTSGTYTKEEFGGATYPHFLPKGCKDSLEVTFVFGDLCNNIDSFLASFYVIDTVPPLIVNFRDSLLVDCSDIPGADNLEIIQSCPSALDITIIDEFHRQGDSTECAFYHFTINRKYIISDNCTYLDTFIQTIQVQNNTPPEFTVPDSITVECGTEDNLEITGIPGDVSHACGSPVTISYQDSLLQNECPQIIIRTWTAIDVCMNINTQRQKIIIEDTQAPFFIDSPVDTILQCTEDVGIIFTEWLGAQLNKEAYDSCGIKNRFAAFPGTYDPEDESTFLISLPKWNDSLLCIASSGDTVAATKIDFVLYDNCINTDITTKTFYIIDSISPEIADCPSSDTIYALPDQCAAYYAIPEINYTDECSQSALNAVLVIGGDTLEYVAGMEDSILLFQGIYQMEFHVIDCAQNRATCQWEVVVLDTTAPEVICAPDSVYLLAPEDCFQNIILDDYIVTDNCGSENLLTSYWLYVAGGDTLSGTLPADESVSLGIGKHIVKLKATDGSGNSATCTSVIEVRDTVPPEAICKPAFITVYPDGQVAPVIAEDFNLESRDNCGIDSMWISPDKFDCNSAGEHVDVTLYVRDKSGLIDSCNTIGQVEMAILNPSYRIDLCNPDTLELYANPPGGDTSQYSYTWTGPNGYTSHQRNPIITGAGPNDSGVYTIVITGPTGCRISAKLDIRISILAEPYLSVSSDMICKGESIILESNNYSGNVTYNWYEGVPPNGVLLGTSNAPMFEISPILGSHTYYVIVNNNICETNPSKTQSVEVVEVPVAKVKQAYINVCEGEVVQLESTNTDPSLKYDWKGPNGFSSTERMPVVSDSATITIEGFYNLTISLGDCVSEVVTIELVVSPIPPTPEIRGDSLICFGDQIILNTESSSEFNGYTWRSSQGQFYVTDVPILIIPSASIEHKGSWTVQVDDGKCTSLASNTFLVDVKPLPDVNISAPRTVCETDSIHLSVESDTGVEFLWVNPSSDTLRGEAVSFENQGGQYKLIAISRYGCVTEEAVRVDIVPKPTITALSSTAPPCIDSVLDITFEPTVFPADDGSYAYSWIHDGTLVGTDSILIINEGTVSDTGKYYLVVGEGSCISDTFEYDLKMTEKPDIPTILSTDFFCESDSIILEVNALNGTNVLYTFYVNDDEYTTDGASLNLGMLEKGTYEIQVLVSVEGCRSDKSAIFEITVEENPDRNEIQGTSILCEGESLLLKTSGVGGEFIWYFNGDSLTTTDERVLEINNVSMPHGGAYTVKQYARGCSAMISDAFLVEVKETPAVPVIESFMDGICVDMDSAYIEICLSQSTFNEKASYQWVHLDSNTEIGGSFKERCYKIEDLENFTDGVNSVYLRAEIDGCFSGNSDTIPSVVSRTPDEIAHAGNDIFACSGEFPILNATTPAESKGLWHILTEATEISSYTDSKAQLTRLRPGENILVWTLSYGVCEDFSTDTVYVYYDVPPIARDDEYSRPFGSSFNMNVLENDVLLGGVIIEIVDGVRNGRTDVGSSSIRYTPYNGFVGADSLVYRICSASCPDACSEAKVQIQIGDDSLCDIPTIFTPNDDGTNDFFTIQCLSSSNFSQNSLKVFNQYGDQVYSAAPYENDWRGTYNGRDLPVGTYFYLMDFGDGREVQKGFVIIER